MDSKETTTYLDTLIVQSQTGADTLVERLTGLASGVNITDLLALHESVLVVKRSLNDTIANSLGYNILGRLFAVEA